MCVSLKSIGQQIKILERLQHISDGCPAFPYPPLRFVGAGDKKGCTRLAAASNKVYQLLAHSRWFSPDTPASSTTKAGRHDIAEILLSGIKHQKSINLFLYSWCSSIFVTILVSLVTFIFPRSKFLHCSFGFVNWLGL